MEKLHSVLKNIPFESELEIEDYLSSSFETIFEDYILIKRQFTLEKFSGNSKYRVDLVGFNQKKKKILLVEIKNTDYDNNSIFQVFRYRDYINFYSNAFLKLQGAIANKLNTAPKNVGSKKEITYKIAVIANEYNNLYLIQQLAKQTKVDVYTIKKYNNKMDIKFYAIEKNFPIFHEYSNTKKPKTIFLNNNNNNKVRFFSNVFVKKIEELFLENNFNVVKTGSYWSFSKENERKFVIASNQNSVHVDTDFILDLSIHLNWYNKKGVRRYGDPRGNARLTIKKVDDFNILKNYINDF